jgi:hypothetical protein
VGNEAGRHFDERSRHQSCGGEIDFPAPGSIQSGIFQFLNTMSRSKSIASAVGILAVVLFFVVIWQRWQTAPGENYAQPSSSSFSLQPESPPAAILPVGRTTQPGGSAASLAAAPAQAGIAFDSALSVARLTGTIADKMTITASAAYGRSLAIAFITYANQHHGQLPVDAQTALDSAHLDSEGSGHIFEAFQHGSLNNIKNPSQTILLRQQAFLLPTGDWARAYVFADGHVETVKTPDGNFAEWEAEHAPAHP